jgi:coenzyme Q-binding protein COQ10
MLELVAVVVSYPRFLPLCDNLVVRKRGQIDGREVLIAEMTVGYKAIRETFTSRVTLDPAALTVHAGSVPEYPSGPFRKVENRWTFADAGRGGAPACDVGFHIAYEFKSLMLGALVGGLFDRVFRRYTHAFEERAHAVYGAPAGTISPR